MQIRLAIPTDAKDIHRLIYELAVYEKAPDEMVATVAQIEQSLFNDSPVAFCHVAEVDGKIGGKLTAESLKHVWRPSDSGAGRPNRRNGKVVLIRAKAQ